MKEYTKAMVRPTFIMMSEGGLTIEQVAKVFDIPLPTFCRWMREHPTLREAVDKGRDAWDSMAAEACLKKRVMGMEYEEVTQEPVEVIDENGYAHTEMQVTKRIKKFIPPDVAALRIWLNNRSPERWRDKITVETTTDDLEERLRKAEERLNAGQGGHVAGE